MMAQVTGCNEISVHIESDSMTPRAWMVLFPSVETS